MKHDLRCQRYSLLGAGFLGSHLIDNLLSQGHNVICLDVFWTGRPQSLDHLVLHPKFQLIKHDVENPIPDSLRVDQIYHLACPASPLQYQKDPCKTLRTCYLGTNNVLEHARKCNARLLVASTSEIYGDPLVYPQPETYFGNVNSFGPRSCYDEGKRVAEALCFAYKQQHKLDIRIARIFNAYGPRMQPDDGRVISNFITAALSGRDLRIFGNGEASRCFQYVDDCIVGLIKLMDSSYLGPVNIGSDIECSIIDTANIVLQLIAERMGDSKSQIVFSENLQDDPARRKPDVVLAEKVLGWKPKTSLRIGLLKTIDWHISLQKSGGGATACWKSPLSRL